MERFAIEYNYGGNFVRQRTLKYVGGVQGVWENCDADKMSIFEIHDMLKEIGITNWKTLQYCDPHFGLKKGLKSLNTDDDVLAMVGSLNKKMYVKVYVEAEDGYEFIDQEACNDRAMIEYNVLVEEAEPCSKIDGFQFENIDFKVNSVSASLNEDMSLGGSHEDEGEEEVQSKWTECTSKTKDVELGMVFGSLKVIKELVTETAMKNGHNVKFVKNEVTRLTAICEDECKWRLHASKVHNEATFQIKTYKNVHTCPRSMDNRHASAKWVATKYVERFKSQPDWPISSIIETVRRDYNINITSILAYRARREARELNDGCGIEQYIQLWSYAEEIKKTNPNSTFVVKVDKNTESSALIFSKAYMCFDACKRGIVADGRPVICLDGCHLKGQCPGILLTAVGIDANDGVYPIAVAVVESECAVSWEWFLKVLTQDLQIHNGAGWTIISDQQKGLLYAFKKVVPQAEIRFCLRHLYANFKKQFRGKLYKDIMMSAARATTEYGFEKEMKRLFNVEKAAYHHLKEIDARTWAKYAFSHHPKCDISLNNLSESFNALLLPARHKPILTMLETIRKIIMTRIVKKYKTMTESSDLLCPTANKKIRKLMNASRNWFPLPAGGDRFEVSDVNDRYVVDLSAETCSCTSWKLTGIPCVHVIPCILFMRKKVEDFVHPYYHRQTYLRMYSHFIIPINGPERWPRTTFDPIKPPTFRRRPGRPKKKRVRDADEPQTGNAVKKTKRMTCRKCQNSGHNSRTCNANIESSRGETRSTSCSSHGIPSGRRRPVKGRGGSGKETFMGFSTSNDLGTQVTVDGAGRC